MIFYDIIPNKTLGNVRIAWRDSKLYAISLFNSELLNEKRLDSRLNSKDIYDFISYFPFHDESIYDNFNWDILDLSGYSTFSLKIYHSLITIRKGQIITYKNLSSLAGFSNASRPCGTSMAKNRFPFLIPCHRVVRGDGIGNYLMGTELKKQILIMEGAFTNER